MTVSNNYLQETQQTSVLVLVMAGTIITTELKRLGLNRQFGV